MPNVSPQWVRETLCEDLADLARKDGRMPDTKAIEGAVDADLQRYQARRREAGIKSQVQRAPDAVAPQATTKDGLDKNDPAGDLAERLDWKVKRGDLLRMPGDQKQYCLCGECKTCRLVKRLSALCQLRPGTNAKHMDFLFPVYGPEILNQYKWHKLGQREYKELSWKDRDRLFLRRCQDIADRSTKELGNWWVK